MEPRLLPSSSGARTSACCSTSPARPAESGAASTWSGCSGPTSRRRRPATRSAKRSARCATRSATRGSKRRPGRYGSAPGWSASTWTSSTSSPAPATGPGRRRSPAASSARDSRSTTRPRSTTGWPPNVVSGRSARWTCCSTGPTTWSGGASPPTPDRPPTARWRWSPCASRRSESRCAVSRSRETGERLSCGSSDSDRTWPSGSGSSRTPRPWRSSSG